MCRVTIILMILKAEKNTQRHLSSICLFSAPIRIQIRPLQLPSYHYFIIYLFLFFCRSTCVVPQGYRFLSLSMCLSPPGL